MNVQEAKAVAANLAGKISSGATLTEEEQQQRLDATLTLLKEYEGPEANGSSAIREQVYEHLNPVPAKTKFLGLSLSPTMRMIAVALSYVGVGAASAYGGVKYEQYRAGRRNAQSTSDSTQHSDSPQSHPATSPLDGRHFNHAGNPGNSGNQTNHPGNQGGGRTRSTANA